ncbi:hypothetical protein AVEN_83732-1 [Araneus ventricosus]|uniref:Uncharacterized protein n=1 Tax=Araneus ventricosus TaxID=182803 RepID=A0A4Y2EU72_ARAVE|nr:hypothetical protein AVEN_83732-1 [Araneus ventricosus]
MSVKPAIHLKYSHAICPKPGFFTHFKRKIQARNSLVFKRTPTMNEGVGSDLLSLSTAACPSLFYFPQLADFNLCYPRARLQSTQGIVLSVSLFQAASDFSFRFQSRRNSNHGKPFGSFP